MKLKTLKDLKEVILMEMHPADVNIFREEFAKELKQQAIKWIKNLKKDFPDYPRVRDEPSRWIKHFFNITDEDLK